jgi:uncharacterized repeat protein (TIGR01451 family)
VTDTLPAGFTVVPWIYLSWSCSASGQTVTCIHPGGTWYEGPIAPGEERVLQIQVSVSEAAVPLVINTATVSTPGDVNTVNNTATDPTTVSPTIPPPALRLAMSHGGNFTVGTSGRYTLIVRNAADAGPTTGPIIVTDTLPPGLTFISGTGAGWSCSAAGQMVTCGFPGLLESGGGTHLGLDVAVGPAAFPSVTNVATVSTPDQDNTINSTASDPTTVVASQCGPRPRVTTQVTRSAPGTLQVRIGGTSNQGTSPNSIQSIQMTIGANALVNLAPGVAREFPNGATGLSGMQRLTPAQGSQPFVFTIHRISNASGATVNLAVADACGMWRTIVGGGVNAF